MLALACLLSGCLQSKENLFDKADAVKPLLAGRYSVEEFKEGVWKTSSEPAFLGMRNGSYTIGPAINPEQTVIDLFPISRRFWTFYIKSGQDPGWYLLLEPRDGKYYIYEPSCTEYLKAKGLTPAPNEPAAKYCDFEDKDSLVTALLAAADVSQPMASLKLENAGEKPPQSASQPTTSSRATPASAESAANSTLVSEDPQFTLSVCNRSKVSADYILFHRHRQEEQKWQLEGWYKVEPGSCRQSRIPRGYFYISANGADGSVWSGNDRHICIVNRAVERIVFEKEKCLVGETNRGFHEVFNKEDSFTYNLNPGKQ